jgi:hypothetical protein
VSTGALSSAVHLHFAVAFCDLPPAERKQNPRQPFLAAAEQLLAR